MLPISGYSCFGPSHRAAFDGASVNGAFGSYATPLGEVQVDKEACDALLRADTVFTYVPEAHVREHCLEVQLPLLQVHLRDVPPIVPHYHRYARLGKVKKNRPGIAALFYFG